jgi:hypothetical protein
LLDSTHQYSPVHQLDHKNHSCPSKKITLMLEPYN